MKVMAKHVRIISFDEMALLKGTDIFNMLGNKVQLLYPSRTISNAIGSHIRNWLVSNIHDLTCINDIKYGLDLYFMTANSREKFLIWVNDIDFSTEIES